MACKAVEQMVSQKPGETAGFYKRHAQAGNVAAQAAGMRRERCTAAGMRVLACALVPALRTDTNSFRSTADCVLST